MCYKSEIQKKNGEKLERKFEEENVPDFIRDAFCGIASREARLNYWSTIRAMLLWFIEKGYIKCESISEITPVDIKGIRQAKIVSYLEYLKYDEKIALSTLAVKKNQMSSFWEVLKNEHYVDDNVIRMVKSEEFKPAKTNRRKMEKMPTSGDIEEMIWRINQKVDKFIRIRSLVILHTLRGSGLRKSELVGLDIDDVYLNVPDEKLGIVSYLLVISKGTYDYSDNGKDIVYLTRDARDALAEWISFRSTLENIQDKKALFVSKDGNRISTGTVQKMFQTYSKGKITPHMMRHEYATILNRETNDQSFVQEQLRWKSSSMMRTVYDSGASRSVNMLDRM